MHIVVVLTNDDVIIIRICNSAHVSYAVTEFYCGTTDVTLLLKPESKLILEFSTPVDERLRWPEYMLANIFA